MKLITLGLFNVIWALSFLSAQESLVERVNWTVSSTTMEAAGNRITYRGKVKAINGSLSLKCDKFVLSLDKEGRVSSFVATGKMVAVERVRNENQHQIVKCTKAEYVAKFGEIVMGGGGPFAKFGERYIAPSKDDSKIIFLPDGKFKVISNAPPIRGSTFVMPR